MARKLKRTDAVIIGYGWTGAIIAKTLTDAGLSVVALERGPSRDTAPDFEYPKIVDELTKKFVDFRRAFTEDGLSIEEFDSFGPTRRTLRQFIAGCSDLGAIIRDFMLPEW